MSKIIVISLLTILAFNLFPNLALADSWELFKSINEELDPVAEIYDAPFGEPQDPRVVIVRIIFYALGFLGVVFLVLILYAGFMWMTAGGNEERVATAKKIISQATVGLIIVITALAVTLFVFKVLTRATGV